MQNDCFPDSQCWDKGPVSVLAHINPRYSIVKGEAYPFIEMAAVGENFGGILSMDSREMEGSGLSRFKTGDTLFAKITPCPENGKIAFVSELPKAYGLGSTEFIVLSPKEGCNPRFLYHLLCSHEVRGRACARMEGSTGRQRIHEDVFERRLQVPLPPPSEQAAIARILDAVDAAIERTRDAIAQARELRLSLIHFLLHGGTRSEPSKKTVAGDIPASWDCEPLGSHIAEGPTNGLYRPDSDYGAYGTPIVRIDSFYDGLIDDLNALRKVVVDDVTIQRYELNKRCSVK